MISVKNLSISFKNSEVVKAISFDLLPRKITALVGQSGSGKSVTALAILKLLRGAEISGEVILDGRNLVELSEQELQKIRGRDIGIVFQDPTTALNPLHKIGKQIAEAITIHNPKIAKTALQNRVTQLLEIVELQALTTRLNDYPHQLSGGQKQRVMLAIALANNPKILIADEPTTALDIRVQNEILNLIVRLKNELGLAVLFITHNLRAVTKIADVVLEMKQGEVTLVENSNLKFVHPLASYVEEVANSSAQQQIISIKNLAVSYSKKTVLSGVNFAVNANENLGIIGESGSGKSTLALALLNLTKAQGEINFFGAKNWQKNNLELRREVQVVFQDPFASLNPRMTVKEIIEEGLIIHKLHNDRESSLKLILDNLNLSSDLLNRYPHQLSGGQRQRVAIARAIILQPKILILDEPTSALDYVTQEQILELLATVQKQQKITYILISHDLEVIARVADRIAVMKDGTIVEIDSKNKILTSPQNPYTQSLIALFK